MDIRERLQGTIERRTFDGASLQLRDLGTAAVSAGGNKVIRVTGYAATTEEGYQVGGGSGAFTETIARGAFKRTLGESPDVVLNINHAEGGQLPLARTRSGTLVLAEDARGLKVDAELDPEDPEARAVASKVRRGDVHSMSFAFRATDDEWSEDRSERVIRSLTIHRGDVSFVSQPANEATSVSVRRRGAKKDVVVRSYLTTIKARRAKLRRSDPTSPATSPFGEFWNIGSGAGVQRAVREVELGKARGPKEAAIKAWIRQRARELGVSAVIPKTDWGAARSRYRRAMAGSRAHPGSDASVEGEEDEPRYSDAAVEALGKEGKAHKRTDGKYNYPIADRRDLLNAIQAWGRARASERASVKAFIKMRARVMRLESLPPESWQSKAGLKTAGGESESPYTGETVTTGGQSA